jgi:hypothetical protein
MIMWEFSKKNIQAEDLNIALVNAGLPPGAEPDTSTRTFRQSWRRFSSVHTEKYQAHLIDDNTVAVVERSNTVKGENKTLDLKHLGTIQIKEYSKGSMNFYYVCLNCGHYNGIKLKDHKVCEKCDKEIPASVQEISSVFRNKLDTMSPEGRSYFYVHYTKALLQTVPFMSMGRPYVFVDQYKDSAFAFANAIRAIGDECYILDLNKNEDARKIVRAGLTAEIEKLKDQYAKLTTTSDAIRQRRLVAIKEAKQKIELFKEVLGVYADDLNTLATDFNSLVLQDLESRPQNQTSQASSDPQAPDSTPSECPASSSESHLQSASPV